MQGLEWVLEFVLVVLLALTLFHAVRLERALGVLKRDRATLESLVDGFNTSTRQAEAGVERLRGAADGAGRQIARQIETAAALRDDLTYLTDRGERLAEKLDAGIRSARTAAVEPPRMTMMAGMESAEPPRVRSQAERDLIKALRIAR